MPTLTRPEIERFLAVATAVRDRLAKAPDFAGLSPVEQGEALSDAVYDPDAIAAELAAAGLDAARWQALMDQVLQAYEAARHSLPTTPADLAAAEAEINARADIGATEKTAAIQALRQGSAAIRQSGAESADAAVIRPYVAQLDALFPDEE